MSYRRFTEEERRKARRYMVREEQVREVVANALAAVLDDFEHLEAVAWPDGRLHPEPDRADLRHFTWEKECTAAIEEAFRLLSFEPGAGELFWLPAIASR